MMRHFRPYDVKYSPDQPRDDHGRFGSGGGAGGGRSALRASTGGRAIATAAKVIGAMVVIAGGVNHLQAYVRRVQRISRANSVHEAIDLALKPVRRKSADVDDADEDRLPNQLARLESLTLDEQQNLLRDMIDIMPDADAAMFLDGLRREGLAT